MRRSWPAYVSGHCESESVNVSERFSTPPMISTVVTSCPPDSSAATGQGLHVLHCVWSAAGPAVGVRIAGAEESREQESRP